MSAEESTTHVLIIEDEPDSAALIMRLIERAFSADVETAGDALQARNRLETDDFDIITIDYRLAEDDGLDLLSEITASDNHPPVIVITGRGDEMTASRAFKAGASDYLVKGKDLASNLSNAFQQALAEASLKRSQDALEEERAFAEAVLNTLPDSFCMFGAEGTAARWNEAFKELTGYSDEEMATMTPFDFHPEEDVNRVLDIYSDIFRTGHRSFVEIEMKTKEGGTFPCMLSCGVLHDNDGNAIGFCGIGRDITEQKQSEAMLHNIIKETNQRREEITALLESTRSILEHKGFKGAAREVFELCGKLIGAQEGYVALVSEDGRQSTLLSVMPEQSEDRVGTLPHMPISRLSSKALSSGRAVYENAFMESEWAEELPEGHHPINNILLAPLVVEGKALGIIVLANKPGMFSNRDALMASAFGEIASIALRNSRTMEALERSEERYRKLVETAPAVIYSISSDTTIRSLNPAFEKLSGWPSEKWIGRSMAGLFHPDDLAKAIETFEQSMRGESPPPYELRILSRSGDYMTGEFTSAPDIEEGKVVGEFGIVRDITEHKKAEQALEESVKRFQDVAGNALAWIWEVDTDGAYTYVSLGVKDILGYEPEEMIGKHFYDIFHAEDREKLKSAAFDSFENRESFREFVNRNTHKDGSTVWLSTSGVPIVDRDGNLVGYRGVDTDITNQKRANDALRLSEERYRSLFRDSPVSLWEEDFSDTKRHLDNLRDSGVSNFREYFNDHPEVVAELAGSVKVTKVNRATLDIYKATDEEAFIGKLDQFICEESYDLIRDELVAISEGKTSFQGDGVNKKLNGDTFYIAIRWSVAPGSEETFSKVVVSIVDITERKRWEQELQMLNTELESYAHMASHDLKGPLSSIMASSVTLRRLVEADDPSIDLPGIREITRKIEANVVESDQLIESLLELAEAGQKPVEVSEVNVTEIVDRVLGERASQVSERGVKVIKDDDLGRVIADSTHLYQLFSNLIDNAIKHNDSDEPVLTVSYMGEESPGAHRYLVRDNGSGFDTGDMEIMLKPFYSGRRGKYGIGLATVRKIIDVYGGTVNIYNDGGACFEFVIKDVR